MFKPHDCPFWNKYVSILGAFIAVKIRNGRILLQTILKCTQIWRKSILSNCRETANTGNSCRLIILGSCNIGIYANIIIDVLVHYKEVSMFDIMLILLIYHKKICNWIYKCYFLLHFLGLFVLLESVLLYTKRPNVDGSSCIFAMANDSSFLK